MKFLLSLAISVLFTVGSASASDYECTVYRGDGAGVEELGSIVLKSGDKEPKSLRISQQGDVATCGLFEGTLACYFAPSADQVKFKRLGKSRLLIAKKKNHLTGEVTAVPIAETQDGSATLVLALGMQDHSFLISCELTQGKRLPHPHLR